MKTPRDFEKLSTSAGLLVLGAGFVSLGALSFIKRHLQDAESGLLLNSASPIIGSLISILLGFAFFVIALLFMPRTRLWWLIAMTVAGSLLGAWLLLVVPSKTMPLVIAAALIMVTIFSLTNRRARSYSGASEMRVGASL
jgi:uncharacterized membrane protein YfcA